MSLSRPLPTKSPCSSCPLPELASQILHCGEGGRGLCWEWGPQAGAAAPFRAQRPRPAPPARPGCGDFTKGVCWGTSEPPHLGLCEGTLICCLPFAKAKPACAPFSRKKASFSPGLHLLMCLEGRSRSVAVSSQAHRHHPPNRVHTPPRPSPSPGLPGAQPPAPTLPFAECPLCTWTVSQMADLALLGARPPPTRWASLGGHPPRPAPVFSAVKGELTSPCFCRWVCARNLVNDGQCPCVGCQASELERPSPPSLWVEPGDQGLGHVPEPFRMPEPDAVLGSTWTSREIENIDLEKLAVKSYF